MYIMIVRRVLKGKSMVRKAKKDRYLVIAESEKNPYEEATFQHDYYV